MTCEPEIAATSGKSNRQGTHMYFQRIDFGFIGRGLHLAQFEGGM